MKTETRTYIGVRVTTKGQLAHFWQDGEKAAGYKKNPAPATIGEVWLFKFDDDGRLFIGGEHRPKQTGTTAKAQQVREWTAADVAARQEFAEAREQKRLANRKTEFDRSLEPVRLLVRAARTRTEKAALIRAVTDDLWNQH